MHLWWDIASYTIKTAYVKHQLGVKRNKHPAKANRMSKGVFELSTT